MSKKIVELNRTWLCRTGCALGQKDRGVSGPNQMFLNSSQGNPKRTDRECRMRHATGNSSIHSLINPVNLLMVLTGLVYAGGAVATTTKTAEELHRQKVYRQIGDSFESLMLNQMYQSMKASTGVDENNPFAPSNGEKIFRAMQEDMMLEAMSKKHPLGISDMVVRQLEGKGGVRTQGRVE